MKNPWTKLVESEGRYLLEEDRQKILHYDSRQSVEARVVLESIPEPFIGNPEKAKLVLLLLNPGHSPEDPKAHREPKFQEALLRNLEHRKQEFAFYPFNPAFKRTPSARWWLPRTRILRESTKLGDQELSQKLMAIEWFPYHSKTSGLPLNPICDSQSYSFYLLKQILNRGTLVVRMRSKSHWENVDRRTLCHALKNPRCGYVSNSNAPDGLFERMVEALRS